jgi:hypothetical protein
MKLLKLMVILGCLASLPGRATLAADKPAKELTCCERAAAAGKVCKHKCCLAAHKQGKSCEKCNPNKEDLKLLKKKADQKANQSGHRPTVQIPLTLVLAVTDA